MALANNTLFAVKDAIDLNFYKITGGSPSPSADYTINYLNDCQIQLDSEQVYATKKGDNYISFSSGRTGTLTMNAEVIDLNFLCMMLGGTIGSEGTISVTGTIPNQTYQAKGVFRCTTTSGDEYRQITFYALKAQVSADLTLSASEVSSFSLVLDILANDQGKIMDIAPATSNVIQGVGEPEVVSIKAKLDEE